MKMMKKIYIQPETASVPLLPVTAFCISGGEPETGGGGGDPWQAHVPRRTPVF